MPRKRQSNAGDQAMFDLLAHIDELESLLEVMDEEGLRTRDDVAARIVELEAEAEALTPPTPLTEGRASPPAPLSEGRASPPTPLREGSASPRPSPNPGKGEHDD